MTGQREVPHVPGVLVDNAERVTLILERGDVDALLRCIACAYSEGQGYVRNEVLRQLGVDEASYLWTKEGGAP